MQAATLTAVVVLPTPPFWFATAYTMPMARPTLAADPVGSPRPLSLTRVFADARRPRRSPHAVGRGEARAGDSARGAGGRRCADGGARPHRGARGPRGRFARRSGGP